MAHRCAILDDYQNVARKVTDWSKVEGDLDIKVFSEHLGSQVGGQLAIARPPQEERHDGKRKQEQRRVHAEGHQHCHRHECDEECQENHEELIPL